MKQADCSRVLLCLEKHCLVPVVSDFCALARVCLSLCCSHFLLALVTYTDDPHRLKRSIKSQVRSQHISLIIHAVVSLNKSLTFQFCSENMLIVLLKMLRNVFRMQAPVGKFDTSCVWCFFIIDTTANARESTKR